MADTSDDVDDLFVSLGGSLMRDLLADLQTGGGDDETWSLEQLEKELAAHLEQPSFVAPSAASLVVSHAQERAAVTAATQPTMYLQQQLQQQPQTPASPIGGDAWSNSLERFTAMSLEKEFLEADSARKHQTITASHMTDFSNAEDYNVSEVVTLAPPPGLSAAATTTPTRSFDPPGMTNVLSNQDSIILSEIAENDDVNHEDQVAALRALLHIHQPKVGPPTKSIPKPPPPTPQNSISGFQILDAMNSSYRSPRRQQDDMPHHGMVASPSPTVVSMTAIPIAAAITGMAWQQSPPPKAPQHQTPMPRVFCNSHPAAHPVPATALESKLMNARDIAYVVHSILKPLLLLGTSESDYDIQYLRRRGDVASGATPTKPKDMQQEVYSRMVKAKEWSNKNSILGHVAKTNISRPRALIATPTSADTLENSEQRDRANLWKARIYCDQGYQAYLALSEAWMANRAGRGTTVTTVGPIQVHLKKLLKCFGAIPPTNPDSDYTVVEPTALELLVKLSKGKALLARVIEQALLPPAAVQVLLPHLFNALLGSLPSEPMDAIDDRAFRSLAFAIQTLPQISPTALITSLQEVLHADSQAALCSIARMECVHALLLRGSTLAAQTPPVNDTYPQEWSRLEGELMAILGG